MNSLTITRTTPEVGQPTLDGKLLETKGVDRRQMASKAHSDNKSASELTERSGMTGQTNASTDCEAADVVNRHGGISRNPGRHAFAASTKRENDRAELCATGRDPRDVHSGCTHNSGVGYVSRAAEGRVIVRIE